MGYTQEEKQRMHHLMKAFSGYVAAHKEIDVAYAEKTGYVRLIVAECADKVYFPIRDFDAMLQMFIEDVFADEIFQVSLQNENFRYSMVDFSKPCERLRAILTTLDEDREYALNKLDQYMQHCREKYDES